MEIVMIKAVDLKHAEYNPRQITEKQFEDIKKSIDRFDVVQPLVVNIAPGRENVVIGGNQRLEILKRIGHEFVPCVVVHIPEIRNEKELNVRLNKNQASFDFDILANDFNIEDLKEWGFNNWELGLGEDPEEKKEEESQTYQVALEFTNAEDQEKFYGEMSERGLNCRKRTSKKKKPEQV